MRLNNHLQRSLTLPPVSTDFWDKGDSRVVPVGAIGIKEEAKVSKAEAHNVLE